MNPTIDQIREKYKITPISTKNFSNDNETAEDKMGFLRGQVEDKKKPVPLYEFGKGVLKGATETVQNVGKMGIEALTLGKADTSKMGIPEETLEAKNKSQKAGKFTERVAEFAIPATKITRATEGLSFLARLATRTASDIAILGAQEGEIKPKEQGVVSVLSQAVPPTLKFGAKFLTNLFKRGAGVLTSKGVDVVEQVLKDSEMASVGIKGDPVQILRSSAKAVVDYTKNLQKQAKDVYAESLAKIEQDYPQIVSGFRASEKDGMTLIHPERGTSIIKDPNGNKFNLSLGTLKRQVTGALKDFNVEGSTKGGFDFSNSSLSTQEEALMNKVVEKINGWTDLTPSGVNRLGKIVEAYARPESASAKRANAIIYRISNSIDNYLSERVPGIAEMSNEFKQSMQFIQQLENHVGQISGKSVTPELIDQVSRKISNLFTANKEIARDVLRMIPGGEDILSVEAGREMAQGVSRTSSAMDKIGALVQTIVPPKRVAQATIMFGKLGDKAEPVIEIMKKLEPTSRGVLIEVLSGLLGQNE